MTQAPEDGTQRDKHSTGAHACRRMQASPVVKAHALEPKSDGSAHCCAREMLMQEAGALVLLFLGIEQENVPGTWTCKHSPVENLLRTQCSSTLKAHCTVCRRGAGDPSLDRGGSTVSQTGCQQAAWPL